MKCEFSRYSLAALVSLALVGCEKYPEIGQAEGISDGVVYAFSDGKISELKTQYDNYVYGATTPENISGQIGLIKSLHKIRTKNIATLISDIGDKTIPEYFDFKYAQISKALEAAITETEQNVAESERVLSILRQEKAPYQELVEIYLSKNKDLLIAAEDEGIKFENMRIEAANVLTNASTRGALRSASMAPEFKIAKNYSYDLIDQRRTCPGLTDENTSLTYGWFSLGDEVIDNKKVCYYVRFDRTRSMGGITDVRHTRGTMFEKLGKDAYWKLQEKALSAAKSKYYQERLLKIHANTSPDKFPELDMKQAGAWLPNGQKQQKLTNAAATAESFNKTLVELKDTKTQLVKSEWVEDASKKIYDALSSYIYNYSPDVLMLDANKKEPIARNGNFPVSKDHNHFIIYDNRTGKAAYFNKKSFVDKEILQVESYRLTSMQSTIEEM